MLRTAFKLALRQTEGLMTSVLTLMGLTLSAPDPGSRSLGTRARNGADNPLNWSAFGVSRFGNSPNP
jgi:hypothetical protein